MGTEQHREESSTFADGSRTERSETVTQEPAPAGEQVEQDQDAEGDRA